MTTPSLLSTGTGLPKTRQAGPCRRIPWQVWVVVVMLGLEGIGNLFSIARAPVEAYWLAAKCLFIAGLLRRWRWVYVVFLVVASYHVLAFSTQIPFVAFLNLVLVVLVASTYRDFFPKGRPDPGPGRPKPATARGFDPEFDA